MLKQSLFGHLEKRSTPETGWDFKTKRPGLNHLVEESSLINNNHLILYRLRHLSLLSMPNNKLELLDSEELNRDVSNGRQLICFFQCRLKKQFHEHFKCFLLLLNKQLRAWQRCNQKISGRYSFVAHFYHDRCSLTLFLSPHFVYRLFRLLLIHVAYFVYWSSILLIHVVYSFYNTHHFISSNFVEIQSVGCSQSIIFNRRRRPSFIWTDFLTLNSLWTQASQFSTKIGWGVVLKYMRWPLFDSLSN